MVVDSLLLGATSVAEKVIVVDLVSAIFFPGQELVLTSQVSF